MSERRFRLFALLFLLTSGNAFAAEPDGRYLYVLTCSGCHGMDGSASPIGRVPALAGSIGHYMKTPAARQFLPQAPGVLTSSLDDREIAALMNWMVPALSGTSLAAAFQPYSEAEIAVARKSRPDDFFVARRAIAADLAAIGAQVAPY